MGMKGKKVLVTGAAGFIGCALSNELVQQGAHVFCLVRAHNPMYEHWLMGTTVYVGDVTSYDLVREIISSNEIDIVFHLAANAIVRVSARDPVSTYKTNVMGTVSVLEACRSVGRCEKIIVASSDKAYGDHEKLPYLESTPLRPKNTYDASKACADIVARSYALNYDMPIIVTRCSNVYGPGDLNMSRLIPNTVTRLIRGEAPILYSDVSGMEREFIYIDDVVSANIALALSGEHAHGCGVNVGGTSEGAIPIKHLVDEICLMFGTDLKPEIVRREAVFKEIQKQYIDSSFLQGITDWKPKFSLQQGLKETIQWYKGYAAGGG